MASNIRSRICSRPCSTPPPTWDLRRLPELFCGFRRERRRGPTLYPVACAPQAWASATPFTLLEAALGLEFDAQRGEIRLRNPRLPAFLNEVVIRDLQLGPSSVDLVVRRHGDEVSLEVLRTRGQIQVSSIVSSALIGVAARDLDLGQSWSNSGGRMRAKRLFILIAVAFATTAVGASWAQNDAGPPQAEPNAPQPSQQQNAAPPAMPNPPAATEGAGAAALGHHHRCQGCSWRARPRGSQRGRREHGAHRRCDRRSLRNGARGRH